MEFENGRKYQKLTKTDKYSWCKKEETVNKKVQKGKNCKCIIVEVCKYDFFSICIYNVIKFFFKKILKNLYNTIDKRK